MNESLARSTRKTNQFGKLLKTEKRTRIGRTTYLMVNMGAGIKVIVKPITNLKSDPFRPSCKGWLTNSNNNTEEPGGTVPEAGQIWGSRNTWGLRSQVCANTYDEHSQHPQFGFRSRKDALDAVKGGKGGRGDKDRNPSKVSKHKTTQTWNIFPRKEDAGAKSPWQSLFNMRRGLGTSLASRRKFSMPSV